MKAGMVDLKKLPRGHPLRNRPLVEIGAETKFKGTDEETGKKFRWHRVKAAWHIARSTFNELAPRAWLRPSHWRAPELP